MKTLITSGSDSGEQAKTPGGIVVLTHGTCVCDKVDAMRDVMTTFLEASSVDTIDGYKILAFYASSGGTGNPIFTGEHAA